MLHWFQKHKNQPWTHLGSAASGESLFRRKRRSTCHRQGKKGQYLGPWAINWKNKDTLLSQTLKVEEKKVSLVFLICGPGAEILAFSHLTISRTLLPKLHKIEWPYLGSLVFQFMAQGPRYWPFFPWRWHILLLLRFKRRNPHISAPGPQIKKLRALSFLQLLKFEKAKCP